MSEGAKDPDVIRNDLMSRVAAERKKMLQRTVDRHGLTGVDVDRLAGASPQLPPAEQMNPEVLKEDEGEEEGTDGGIRFQLVDAPAEEGAADDAGGEGGSSEDQGAE